MEQANNNIELQTKTTTKEDIPEKAYSLFGFKKEETHNDKGKSN